MKPAKPTLSILTLLMGAPLAIYYKAVIFSYADMLFAKVLTSILYSSVSQTMDRDPPVGRKRNFGGSCKVIELHISCD